VSKQVIPFNSPLSLSFLFSWQNVHTLQFLREENVYTYGPPLPIARFLFVLRSELMQRATNSYTCWETSVLSRLNMLNTVVTSKEKNFIGRFDSVYYVIS